MIFSSLFKTKPNWQHKDATTRITAINDELAPDNTEQLQILSELIASDESDLVRRAALIKVGSFKVYQQASIDNSFDKVKQFASKQVHDILATDHKLVITADEKRNILTTQAQKPFLGTSVLEAWFAHEKESDIQISLYQLISVNKKSAHFLTQSFTQKQTSAFQSFILGLVDDLPTLEKLAKKACDSDIEQKISEKISAIQEAIEKPQKITKQLQLILAKLQALKDVTDYGQYKKRKSILIHEWQALESDLGIFSQDELTVFNDKYQSIMAHLEKLFVAKAENYKQQIIADKLAHDKQQDKKAFTQQLSEISQALTNEVFSKDALDEELFKTQLSNLATVIKASVLNNAEQQTFITQVEQLRERLTKIPEIAEYISEATLLISKISQLALPKTILELNDSQESYNEWLKSWRHIEENTAGILPDSISQAKKEIVQTWKEGIKALQNEQKDLFFTHKKKLVDIKRLLNNGKYKVCFGLFKGVEETFTQLSVKQQQQLQRDFSAVSEKMTELSDWEHYIATPRKQELLSAIQALVETPLDNPNEQAEKVKAYRKTWNSLGHADEDVDKQLNEQFNNLCEQAFAPCRLFYAEQEKLREQHLIQRQQILAQAEKINSELQFSLSDETDNKVDYKQLEGQINRLQKEWQNCGEVDRNLYKKLQQQFRDATQPAKEAIKTFQQTNIEAKQSFINKAEQLLASDDIFSAIESAKKLQQAWKDIGFAGNHQENKLWQKFREVNDELFAKRQQLKTEQQAELQTQQNAFETLINDIEQAFENETEKSSMLTKQYNEQASELLAQVIASKPVIKVVASRIERFIKKLEVVQSEYATLQEKQNWTALFELLAQQAQSNIAVDELTDIEQYTQLSTFWKKRVLELSKLTQAVQGNNRIDKTLEIEILAQAESPKEFAAQRLKVQVKLMQDQMLSGNTIDLTKQLADWLMLGQLTEAELPQIARLQSVYCK